MELVFKLALVIVCLANCQSAEVSNTVPNDEAVVLLAKRMDAFEARNEVLSDENEDLKARIKALEAISTNQQREIERLTAVSEEQVAVNKHLVERLQKLEEQARPDNDERLPQKKSLEKARAISRIRKASNEATVAFFAVLNTHIENPGVHQAVAFDKVITNVGNAYNQHAGDFRAPVSGVYVFSTTLMSGTSAVPYHFYIMRNGSTVSRIYIPNGGTATQEVVLHLSQGDDVAIHNIDAGNRLYGDWYSSFSGFLLQEDVPEVGLVGKMSPISLHLSYINLQRL